MGEACKVKLFTYKDPEIILLCWAFNSGHAAKQIAKYVEDKGREFRQDCPLEEVPEANKKGAIYVLRG
jgi:hypothetical protein